MEKITCQLHWKLLTKDEFPLFEPTMSLTFQHEHVANTETRKLLNQEFFNSGGRPTATLFSKKLSCSSNSMVSIWREDFTDWDWDLRRLASCWEDANQSFVQQSHEKGRDRLGTKFSCTTQAKARALLEQQAPSPAILWPVLPHRHIIVLDEIELITLLPHSTHMIQPLDRTNFKPSCNGMQRNCHW